MKLLRSTVTAKRRRKWKSMLQLHSAQWSRNSRRFTLSMRVQSMKSWPTVMRRATLSPKKMRTRAVRSNKRKTTKNCYNPQIQWCEGSIGWRSLSTKKTRRTMSRNRRRRRNRNKNRRRRKKMMRRRDNKKRKWPSSQRRRLLSRSSPLRTPKTGWRISVRTLCVFTTKNRDRTTCSP